MGRIGIYVYHLYISPRWGTNICPDGPDWNFCYHVEIRPVGATNIRPRWAGLEFMFITLNIRPVGIPYSAPMGRIGIRIYTLYFAPLGYQFGPDGNGLDFVFITI
jgi:hypothetical protein